MDEMAWSSLAENAQNPNFGDERLLVQFFLKPTRDEVKSAEEGRAVFVDVEHIRIRVPGDRSGEVVREIRDSDKERFAKAYAHWKSTGRTDGIVGTPLATWPQITRSQVEELAFFNVKTVEALAGLSDLNLQKFPFMGPLREKARDFVADAKEKAPVEKLHAALAEKDNQIAALMAAVDDLKAQVQDLRKKK